MIPAVNVIPMIEAPNTVPDNEKLREKALEQAAAMLRKLNEIRRTLEMPVEQLPIVIETYNRAVHALIVAADREERLKNFGRSPMTMRSETADYKPMKLAPGNVFRVIGRPQNVFRPEDFTIHGDRARWIVHDILVGGRSQFMSRRGPAPGTEFGPGGICEHLRLETCHVAMDLVLEVEYVGPEADGEIFEATIVGTTC